MELVGDKKLKAAGTASSLGSFASAHNVCHSLCLGVVAILSVFGIIVSSDILMFLENYNLIFWFMGTFFLGLSFVLYFKFGQCISEKLILFNSGLILFGFPFFREFGPMFSIIGGTVSLVAIGLYLKERVVDKGNLMIYFAIAVGILLLMFTIYSSVQASAGAPENIAAQPNLPPVECGDIKDISNVQHLSHHPDKFGGCIELVDAAIFENAVGQKKEDYIKSNGLV